MPTSGWKNFLLETFAVLLPALASMVWPSFAGTLVAFMAMACELLVRIVSSLGGARGVQDAEDGVRVGCTIISLMLLILTTAVAVSNIVILVLFGSHLSSLMLFYVPSLDPAHQVLPAARGAPPLIFRPVNQERNSRRSGEPMTLRYQ